MLRTKYLVSLSLCALFTLAVQAQIAPIRPGLWQVHVDRETNGEKALDMSEHLKSMPPERRAQAEAMMKQHGMDPSGMKSCQTAQMLDSKNFSNPMPQCKTTYSTRTNSLWKSHTSCPNFESDGEITFSNSENYTVKTTSVIQEAGQAHTSHMTMTGKWLSADCGDIKPLTSTP